MWMYRRPSTQSTKSAPLPTAQMMNWSCMTHSLNLVFPSQTLRLRLERLHTIRYCTNVREFSQMLADIDHGPSMMHLCCVFREPLAKQLSDCECKERCTQWRHHWMSEPSRRDTSLPGGESANVQVDSATPPSWRLPPDAQAVVETIVDACEGFFLLLAPA